MIDSLDLGPEPGLVGAGAANVFGKCCYSFAYIFAVMTVVVAMISFSCCWQYEWHDGDDYHSCQHRYSCKLLCMLLLTLLVVSLLLL